LIASTSKGVAFTAASIDKTLLMATFASGAMDVGMKDFKVTDAEIPKPAVVTVGSTETVVTGSTSPMAAFSTIVMAVLALWAHQLPF